MALREVFAAIRAERDYQDAKYGSLTERFLSLGEWLLIMEAELDEAKLGFVKSRNPDECLAEILQVVTVGVAALQQHGLVERTDLHESS